MQAERDHLRDFVFPELEERLRQRYLHLEPIDLRIGVETISVEGEQAKELLVLKVCLNEIERSRPFLIALLGDRYGWIPPEERMQAAIEELGFCTIVTGKSLTALEIEFGVLDSPEQKRLTHIYFRDPLPYDEMPAEIAASFSERHQRVPNGDATAALVVLKQRIESDPALRGRVHRYAAHWDGQRQCVTGLDAFGRQVCEDLWADLDRESRHLLRKVPATWQEEERRIVDEFAVMRSHGFVGRADIIPELMRLAVPTWGDIAAELMALVSSSWPADLARWGACLVGEPGSGKSALFGRLYTELNRADDLLLLAHAVGISSRGNRVEMMLRRWVEELARAVVAPNPVQEGDTQSDRPPHAVEAIAQHFERLLSQVARQTRVLLLIDALDQFERTPMARHLKWLPKALPQNVRLIATTTPGVEFEALAQRPGVRVIPLAPLDLQDAEQIAQGICGRYHRRLDADVLKAVLDHRRGDGTPSCGNPLWLELSVEQLNLVDADDFARADREYTGTPEQRLHNLVLDLAVGLPGEVTGLYDHMLERCEQLHGQTRATAFATAISLCRFGWREADLRVLVPAIRSVIDLAGAATRPPSAKPPGLWHRLFSSILPNRHPPAERKPPTSALPSPSEEWTDLTFGLLRRSFRAHLVQRGAQGQWDFFHAQARAAVQRRYLQDEQLVQQIHWTIADHVQTLSGTDAVRHTELLWHLAVAGDRARSATHYNRVSAAVDVEAATAALVSYILDGSEQDRASRVAWVASLPQVADLNEDKATDLAQRLVNDVNAALRAKGDGRLRTELILAVRDELSRCGLEHFSKSSHAATMPEAQRAWTVGKYADCLGTPRQIFNLALANIKLGEAYAEQGRIKEALATYQRVVKAFELLKGLGPEYRDLLATLNARMGALAAATGGNDAASQQYEQQLHAAEHERDQLKALHEEAWSMHLPAQRRWAEAQENVADAALAQGRLAEARRHYEQAFNMREQLLRQNPADTNIRQDWAYVQSRMAQLALAEGDLSQARRSFEECLRALLELTDENPDNMATQRNLATAYERLGTMALQVRDPRDAERHLTRCLEIRKALAKKMPDNAPVQQELLTAYVKCISVFVILKQSRAKSCLEEAQAHVKLISARSITVDPTLIGLLRQIEGQA